MTLCDSTKVTSSFLVQNQVSSKRMRTQQLSTVREADNCDLLSEMMAESAAA